MNALLLLAPLLVYWPAFIPGAETQPLLGAVLIAVVIAAHLPRVNTLLLILASVMFVGCALQVLSGISARSIAASSVLLLGPTYFLALVVWKVESPSRRLCGTLAVLLALVGLVELLMPSVYSAVAGSLGLRALGADGHRGLSYLTPEPTYAVISIAYVLALALWSRVRVPEASWFIELVLISLLISTLSTYAIVFLLVVLIATVPRSRLLDRRTVGAFGVLVLAGALLLLAPWTVGAAENVRAVRAVVNIVGALQGGELLGLFSVVDPSLGARASVFLLSVVAPFDWTLGIGLGCDAMTSIARDHPELVLANPVIEEVLATGCLRPQSYALALLVAFGVPGAVFVGLLVAFAWRVWARSRRLARVGPVATFAFGAFGVMLIVQAQVTQLVPWVLLYALYRLARRPAAFTAGRTAPAMTVTDAAALEGAR